MSAWDAARRADVVILTAIRLEFDAVLEVDAGAAAGSVWEIVAGPNGLPVAFRSFEVERGRALRVAVAVSPDMGATAAVNTLLPLVEKLEPRCIAMCGVCAGRRDKANLGDVVAAERLFYHDTGKQLPDQVQQDLMVYKLRDDWKAALEGLDAVEQFRDAAWLQRRPLTTQWREYRALIALRDGVPEPWNAVEPGLEAKAWKRIVDALRERRLLAASGRALTDEGRRVADDLLFEHQEALPDLSPAGAFHPFRLHVAPMGSGTRVIEDEKIWGVVSQAMRKTLALEMESAVLGELAHRQRHRRLDVVVMKGVMDFADHGRDDHFKEFAARAAAECLLWFLRKALAITTTETAETSAPPDHEMQSPRPLTSRPNGAQFRSTVKSTAGEPRFTGRSEELGSIEKLLQAQRIVVVHGAPGLGKSRLAKEYAHQHVAAYPGGMFIIPFDQPPPTELAKLLRDTDRPAYPDESVEDQCRRALHALGSTGRALLIYDAVVEERVLRDWLPYDGLDWHLIVTTTSARWASAWSTLELEPLQPSAAGELAAAILGDEPATNRLAEAIATNAAGITIELCASAAAVRERLRRGRTVERVSAELAKETSSSFESAWMLLSPEAQLVLQVASTFVTPRVPASLIVSALQRIGWQATRVEDAIDNARDRKLGGGDNDNLDVHQLVARFVRARAFLDASVHRALFDELLSTARAFSERPGDLDRRALMLAHSLEVEDWATLVTDASEWHVVGNAIAELGKFAEALTWSERAVSAKEKGDMHGRVDHTSLGTSLHLVGYCHSRQGKFTEALPWFERAVVAKEKGDVHGRVNPESLGTSLHQVGYCYAKQGQLAEALPWFARAVAKAEQGDVDGRVDSESLGTSLAFVGDCYSRQGQFAEALPWVARAVTAKERGDVHGRVDPASLGTSLHQVGYCYVRQGQFAEALPWFERAVAAKGRGDVHGRMDPESLGASLHMAGYCYASQGQFAEALPWFERAVAAAEQGDMHGRVDPASVGVSLYMVGDCYVRQDQFAEALPWFECAVAAEEKGDVHGRVDPESFGKTLHQVGTCYSSQGKFAEALPWFERAAAAKEKGDGSGRVDPSSLGTSLRSVGDCYASLGKDADAQPWFERASMVLKREPDP